MAVEVPSVFFTDAPGACYHTTGDDTRQVDFGKLGEQARTTLRMAITLAEAEETPAFVPPDPALASYDDAVALDRVLERLNLDLALFRTADREVLRTRLAELNGMVMRGPDAFGAEDVPVLLEAALDILDAIESDFVCAGYFAPERRPFRMQGGLIEAGDRSIGSPLPRHASLSDRSRTLVDDVRLPP